MPDSSTRPTGQDASRRTAGATLGATGPFDRSKPQENPMSVAPPPVYADTQLEITEVVVGPMDNNVYVARCRATGEAVLLDAANEHERLLDLCRALGVRRVLETHGHWDHIQAVPAVRDAGYEVGVTAADAAMLPSYDFVLEDDSVIEVGRLRLRTIATPGHTPGSMCFLVEGSPVLFSGDTLFPGGPGNTSFEGGNFETIITSIDERLFSKLAADVQVLPGHGADTTLGTERPHLEEWIDRGW
jgi:glyoxylase-like metal-dependent hydrolase (beta-lactamase superfamily II)